MITYLFKQRNERYSGCADWEPVKLASGMQATRRDKIWLGQGRGGFLLVTGNTKAWRNAMQTNIANKLPIQFSYAENTAVHRYKRLRHSIKPPSPLSAFTCSLSWTISSVSGKKVDATWLLPNDKNQCWSLTLIL